MGPESVKVDRLHNGPLQMAIHSSGDGSKANDCVIAGAHAFILRVSSFFGLAPLRFKFHRNGFIVTISKTMCIYSYFLVTILALCTILGLAAEINVGVELSVRMTSKMSQAVSTCDVLVVLVTAGAGVYGAPRRMKTMLRFMESMALIDKNIGTQYSVKTERKLCAVLLAILIFFLILILDDFCFYVLQAKRVDRHWDMVVNYIGFYMLWCVVIVLELQFAFTALSVHARFAAVNDALGLTARDVTQSCVTSSCCIFQSEYVTEERSKCLSPLNIFAIGVPPDDTQRSPNVCLLTNSSVSRKLAIVNKLGSGEPRLLVTPGEAVYQLAKLHGTLCEVVMRVNDSYGLPLIAILISTLLHLIVTPYFLIIEIIVSRHRLHFLVLQFLWCATHLIRMFVIVEPCHYTVTEGKRTEGLICHLMTVAPIQGALSTRLKLFSRQLMLQSVSYQPLGMCTLDRPLVVAVIGAVTTYLVILIQFQKYEN